MIRVWLAGLLLLGACGTPEERAQRAWEQRLEEVWRNSPEGRKVVTICEYKADIALQPQRANPWRGGGSIFDKDRLVNQCVAAHRATGVMPSL